MKISAKAFHLENAIIIKDTFRKLQFNLVRKESTFILYQLTESSFCYIKNYGGIAFINCDNTQISSIIKELDSSIKTIENLPFENYTINIDKEAETDVSFDSITIKELNPDVAHIILLNLAQSVVMEHYYNISIGLVSKINSYTTQLEERGNLMMSFTKMRKFIGETMNIKNRIAKNLFVFETTDLAWSTKELSEINEALKSQLDVVNRFHSLQGNLDIVKENLDFFQSIIQHKHSSKLEWIIIILILIEIIHILI